MFGSDWRPLWALGIAASPETAEAVAAWNVSEPPDQVRTHAGVPAWSVASVAPIERVLTWDLCYNPGRKYPELVPAVFMCEGEPVALLSDSGLWIREGGDLRKIRGFSVDWSRRLFAWTEQP